MIHWPAVIKFHGEDELIFIYDEAQWQIDFDQHSHTYTDDDVLIDAKGMSYQLHDNKNKKIIEVSEQGKQIPLDEFELLVKKHLVQLNQCCIAKFSIASFNEGMDIVKSSDE